MIAPELLDRIQTHADDWGVIIEDTVETASSVITFGERDRRAVVLKVVKQIGDEWRSGAILKAFDGNGVVRVYEHVPGAILMERLLPGNSLVETVLTGRDDEATDILAEVIQQMSVSALELPGKVARVQDWGRAFDRYVSTGGHQISMELVEAAQTVFSRLGASQCQPRLLHGDLQHYNVLFDSNRGWLAIDPKGVIGEVEYEIGAALRNPIDQPEVFLSRATIERRLKKFVIMLNLDFDRALAWAFGQAILSAIWTIEDGYVVDPTNPSLRLATAIRPMLGALGTKS